MTVATAEQRTPAISRLKPTLAAICTIGWLAPVGMLQRNAGRVFGARPHPQFVLQTTALQTHLSEEKNFMNKTDLVDAVAQATDTSKADAANAVDAVLDTITDALKSGDGVQLIGFGNFSVADRAAREGRNPRTGETIQIAASKQPKFKAGKALKDAVNG